ncbi:alpha-1,3-galactosidase-related protein [Clostridium sp.]
MKKIKINNYYCEDLQDWTYTVNKVLGEVEDETIIEFEKGTYYFHTKYALDKYCYISNNDHGLKKIAFLIKGKKKITIEGNGSEFIFTGRIIPFFIQNSSDVTLKNFSVDYKRPFFTQGEVLESSEDYVKIKIDKMSFPYIVKNEKITFIGEEYESDYIHNVIEYEKIDKRPILGVRESYTQKKLKVTEIEPGIVTIEMKFKKQPEIGKMLVIKHERRLVPGIAIDCCNQIKIDSVHIKQAGTMGIVAQYTKDIELNKVIVATDEKSERVISANADAIHFAACRGDLVVENCRFESQLDDALNVHGNYLDIDRIINNKTVIARIGHYQQIGIFGLEIGTSIGIIDKDTMLSTQETTLIGKKIINNQYAILTFKDDLTLLGEENYCIEDLDAYPTLVFRNNIVANNRARGILLKSSKPILIENNTIIGEGSAIKICCDADNWYESGAVRQLIIKNNYLASVNEGIWGEGIINIDSKIKTLVEDEYYQGNIIIENNTIELGDKPLIYGYSFKSLVLKNNEFIVESANKKLSMDVKHYGTLKQEGNIYKVK